jgi:hypothetical protein
MLRHESETVDAFGSDNQTTRADEVKSSRFRRAQARSQRSRFITLFHAVAKSLTKISFESSHA